MASIWYRTGTITLTQGSDVVLGAGTAFIANVKVGDMFIGPLMDMYEVTNVTSDAQLNIDKNYEGASYSGSDWAIAPTTAQLKQLASQISSLIAIYQDIPDAATSALADAQAAAASQAAATTSATSAADSASAALADKTAVDASKVAAATSETNAAASAGTATTQASAASDSAAAALASKNAAATSETNAAASASTASTQAGASATSATAAAGSASAALASKSAAGTSETNAATSAATATTKAGNAATSETNAAASATTATTKAAAAASSASDALGYRDQTQSIADSVASSAVTSVAGRTGAVTLAKGDVGLGSVDNTSDASKPVSTAQAAADATKAAKGANSDITSLAGLTTALSIGQGGTGAKTGPLALAALGAAPLDSAPLTGTPTAPNPAAGTRGTRLATMQAFASEFAVSVAGNGYAKLPSGLIIQWGSANITADGDNGVSLPIAWTNALVGAWATVPSGVVGFTAVARAYTGVAPLTALLIGVWNGPTTRAAAGVNWLALGF